MSLTKVCGQNILFYSENKISNYLQERDISVHVNEIIDKWELCKPKEEIPKTAKDVDIQLAKLLESQSLATTSRKEYTDEEKKIREAILSQYSQLSDNEVRKTH